MLQSFKVFALVLLPPALAYVRTATTVPGLSVEASGNVTRGGKVGVYGTLLKVKNPQLGELKMTMECCGNSASLVDHAAYLINTNQYEEPVEEAVEKDFAGKGKCSVLDGKEASDTVGKAKCSYMYSYGDKDWTKYKYSAFCVPSDILSNYAGDQSTKMGYVTTERGLNRQAGDLVYVAEGFINWCYDAMNQVNEGDSNFKKVIPTVVKVNGQKIDTGYKEQFGFHGLGKLTAMDMMERSAPVAFTGVLYVFKNDFWIKKQEAMNITHFDDEQMKNGPKMWNQLSNFAAPLPGSLQAAGMADLYSKIGKDMGPMMGKDLKQQKEAEALTAAQKLKEAEEQKKNPEWKKIWRRAEWAKAAYEKTSVGFTGDVDPAAAKAAVEAFSASNGDDFPPTGPTMDPDQVKAIYDTVVAHPEMGPEQIAGVVAKLIAEPIAGYAELKSGQEEAIKKALTAPAAPAGPAAPATPASPGDKAAALKAMLADPEAAALVATKHPKFAELLTTLQANGGHLDAEAAAAIGAKNPKLAQALAAMNAQGGQESEAAAAAPDAPPPPATPSAPAAPAAPAAPISEPPKLEKAVAAVKVDGPVAAQAGPEAFKQSSPVTEPAEEAGPEETSGSEEEAPASDGAGEKKPSLRATMSKLKDMKKQFPGQNEKIDTLLSKLPQAFTAPENVADDTADAKSEKETVI